MLRSSTVPNVGKAAVCTQRGADFQLQLRYDYPVPQPKDDELLIKLSATGICVTDIHHLLGHMGPKANADCVGHEGSGVVVAMGDRVSGWKIGDRAGVKPSMGICGTCEYCREGYEGNCPDRITAGYNGVNGTYCEYITHRANHATRLPEGLDDKLCAPLLCAGTTAYRAVRQTSANLGDWLIISGAGGGVGSMVTQYAAASGMRVIALDTSDSKRDMCLQLGCEKFIDFKLSKDVAAEVHQITNGLGARAMVITGATKAAYENWVDLLRVGGTLVCVGLPPQGTAYAGADPIFIIRKSLKIKGTLTGSYKENQEAVAIAATGKVAPIITEFSFKDFVMAVNSVKNNKLSGRAVIKYNE